MPFAFLYHNHPGPGGALLLVCLAMLAGAIFPGFFSKEEDLPWPFRLYMGLAGLLGLGPLLFGKVGAALYPAFFAVASVVAFSPLRWAFRGEPKSGAGQSSIGEALASDALLVAGPQAFLQLLSLNSVAATSLPLFWLWAIWAGGGRWSTTRCRFLARSGRLGQKPSTKPSNQFRIVHFPAQS